MKEAIKKLLQLLAGSEGKDANARAIAKHLAKNYLYDLDGPDALYPDVAKKYKKLVARMKKLNKPVYMSEGFRSARKQDTYFNRTPKITNAKGLQSYHQYGLAFDLIFVNGRWNPPSAEWWEILGKEGKKLGLEWGGDWKGSRDRPHFEWHPSFTWRELEKYFS